MADEGARWDMFKKSVFFVRFADARKTDGAQDQNPGMRRGITEMQIDHSRAEIVFHSALLDGKSAKINRPARNQILVLIDPLANFFKPLAPVKIAVTDRQRRVLSGPGDV